ncbi:MAG TPA: plasmid pRiA4b ORF-3 family protein, partial [Chloroflexota bacterium]|nr:plasmid pRiA4b ORF-3 family protein [Chloroflexota bacterium]
ALRDLLAPEPSLRERRLHRGRTRLSILQLKCTLKRVKPPIWRRLLVRSDTRLDQLHHILQLVMGWSDSHLYEFVANGVAVGNADEDWSDDVEHELDVNLADVVSVAGDRLLYRYDFGDGWECDLVLEDVLDPQPGFEYPLCVTGRRAGPPEDVGGVWGYAQFLAALADPTHPDHKQQVHWAGGDFDPEQFDPDRATALFRQFLHDRPLGEASR